MEPEHHRLWIDLVLSAVVFAAFFLATAYISSVVEKGREFRYTPDAVETFSEGLSDPLVSDAEEDIRIILSKTGAFSPLKTGDIYKIKTALLSSPWVKTLEYARMSVTGAITFSVEVRTPCAWVLRGKYCHLCDTEGVRLPVSAQFSPESAFTLPLICGLAPSEQLPPIGERWSQDILEGVSVAAVLNSSSLKDTITPLKWKIDISELKKADGKVLLLAADGCGFEWGRSPISAGIDLVSSKEKLDNLTFLLKSNGVVGKRSYYLLWTVPTVGPRAKEDSPAAPGTESERKVTGNSPRWRDF